MVVATTNCGIIAQSSLIICVSMVFNVPKLTLAFPCYLHYIVPPGADDTISAMPLNRNSILVTWLSPVFSRDPLLLRYNLFYTSDGSLDPTNYSTAQSVPNILPTLRNGSVSPQGIVEYVLSGLQIGTEHSISVRASFQGLDAPNSFYVAKTSTYGQGWYMYMYMCALFPSRMEIRGLNVLA